MGQRAKLTRSQRDAASLHTARVSSHREPCALSDFTLESVFYYSLIGLAFVLGIGLVTAGVLLWTR